MPPTTPTTMSFGSTAPIAAIPFGPSTLAGKNFSAEAPARIARKASVGVKTPGMVTMEKSAARASTAASTLGLTSSRPPAACSRSTSPTLSTVPAPTSAEDGRSATIASIEANGSGEFNGTSIASMPASNTARPIAVASCGPSPRRIATMPRSSFGHAALMP